MKLVARIVLIGFFVAAGSALAAAGQSRTKHVLSGTRRAAASKDFSVSVTIDREGAEPKLAVVEMKNGTCRTTNGSTSRARLSAVCQTIGDEIRRDEATYTTLPWINSPEVPSFIVTYRGSKSDWTKQTGVAPDAQSKEREALRKLAVRVLETAQ